MLTDCIHNANSEYHTVSYAKPQHYLPNGMTIFAGIDWVTPACVWKAV